MAQDNTSYENEPPGIMKAGELPYYVYTGGEEAEDVREHGVEENIWT